MELGGGQEWIYGDEVREWRTYGNSISHPIPWNQSIITPPETQFLLTATEASPSAGLYFQFKASLSIVSFCVYLSITQWLPAEAQHLTTITHVKVSRRDKHEIFFSCNSLWDGRDQWGPSGC